jgi:hypothetical protein
MLGEQHVNHTASKERVVDWDLCDIQEIVAHYSTIASGNQVVRDVVDKFGAR